ncbi:MULTISPECIES: EAL domain-containing protein [unclassified Nostoc]|uniref:EAL domain-containing protein n=1 Tax=unclassified Nostoc TaxID=2593658 RepID=UPI002AD481AD|nr:EAL domain-containing protein [Nostoc sp. DedQUE03]MDZ7973011.1 EAL domain-containing protein [Nostoc sp. DedQUE03]MDZ8044469.1 EAL domain-containing protein [Nostoc sp. DedQUE02]
MLNSYTLKIITTFTAVFSIILGFVVMVAWQIHLNVLIQVLPDSTPIRYNTALAFFFCGWALLALIKGWRPFAVGLSLLVVFIGSLTLAEYIFEMNFGIDQLFIQDYLTNNLPTSRHSLRMSEPVQQFLIEVHSSLPGRPSANTALGFTLLGIASLCLSLARISKHLLIVTGLFSAGAIAIGVVALIGYFSGIGTAYKWGYLTGVAIPTALGLLMLGVSLQFLTIERVKRLPQWFPLNIGFGILTANLFLWQAINSWKNILVKHLSNITNEVESMLTPVAHLVLLEGFFLTLLVTLVLYFTQLAQKQAAKLKRKNYDLLQSNSLLQATLESTADSILVLDAQGRKINFNTQFIEMWQITDSVLNAMRWEQDQSILLFIASQLQNPEAFLQMTSQMFNHPEQKTYNVWEFQDGRVFELYTRSQWISDRPVGRVFSFRDITERKQMQEALFYEKELAQVTLHSIGDAVITTNATGKIEYLNPVAEMLTGWSQQQVKGLPLKEVFRIFHETTREPAENPVEKALKSGRIVGLANHTVLITRDEREIAIDDSAAPIRDRHNQIVGAVMVFHDVTQNRSLSRQLSWQASHDSLTGLVNRHEFEQRLEQAVSNAKIYKLEHALCYLDLDQFKIVNDTSGHAAGDELLRQVTRLLQMKIRQTDVLARLGGDEFGALLYQCSLEKAMQIANIWRETIQGFRFIWQDNIFAVGVSIGLVKINASTENQASLLSHADAACYVAKDKGRNRVHVFQSDDEELLQQRGEMQWVSRINKALTENRFCLYSQAIVAIAPTQAEEIHYEILLRLRDEKGNLVVPMAFIPAAQRYNLMPTIDRWVIKTLFKSWSLAEHNSKTVYAINLSGTTINDDQFISFLREQFLLHHIRPQSICFEITETVAIANLTKACQLISELQQYGCRFSLDDFGSGMSSFTYLKTLPVNYLKIDGGFIKNIIENSVDDAMVEAIARIANVMGVKTIAEFVENDAILQRLKALGVDYAQGYGVAKPRPLVFA